MQILLTSALGITASVLSIVSLTPQVVRTVRTQSTRDISLAWLLIALAGMSVWMVYGWQVGAAAVVWANAATAVQAGLILAVKAREARRRRAAIPAAWTLGRAGDIPFAAAAPSNGAGASKPQSNGE
jgi:MtN3 and saliva related transmembrane protein